MWLTWDTKLRVLPGSCQLEAARHPKCASRINTRAVHLRHSFQHPRLNNASAESKQTNALRTCSFFPPGRGSIRTATSPPRLRAHEANSKIILVCTRIHSPTPLQITPAFPAFLPQAVKRCHLTSSSSPLDPTHPRAALRLATQIHSSQHKRRTQLANKLPAACVAADGTGSCGGERKKGKEEEKQSKGIIPA